MIPLLRRTGQWIPALSITAARAKPRINYVGMAALELRPARGFS